MVVVIMKRDTDGGIEYLHNLLWYMKYDRMTGKERADFVDMRGFGVDCHDIGRAYDQMMRTRQYFRKIGGNPLVHYIVSFDLSVKDEATAFMYCYSIAEYFKDTNQVIWAIHRKKRIGSLYHAHFLVNSVSFVNGRMIDSYHPEIAKFGKHVKEVVKRSTVWDLAGFRDDVG